MYIPIETIIALVMVLTYRSSGLRPAGGLAWLALAFMAAWVAAVWIVSVISARAAERALRADPAGVVRALERHRRLDVLVKAFMLLAFGVQIFFLGWMESVGAALGRAGFPLFVSLVALAPFLAALLANWAAGYRLSVAVTRYDWTLGEYLMHHVRYSLFILLPMFVLMGVYDAARLLPASLVARIGDNIFIEIMLLVAIMVAMMAVLPVALRLIWESNKMPDGELRRRFLEMCRGAGVGVREILIWRLGGGRMMNAAVMGLVGRLRYVMMSEALLRSLAPEECEAVLGHELGHVVHNHLWYYVLFSFGFVLASTAVFDLASPLLRDDQILNALLTAALVVLYWRVVFGAVSRRFERQADACSARLMGTPMPLVGALESLAAASGGIRDLGSWRHYSIAERVKFLLSRGSDPEALASYNRKVGRMTAMGALTIGLLMFLVGSSRFEAARMTTLTDEVRSLAWSGRTQEAVAAAEVLAGLLPDEPEARIILGDAALAAGRREKAEAAYREALRLYREADASPARARLARLRGAPPKI